MHTIHNASSECKIESEVYLENFSWKLAACYMYVREFFFGSRERVRLFRWWRTGAQKFQTRDSRIGLYNTLYSLYYFIRNRLTRLLMEFFSHFDFSLFDAIFLSPSAVIAPATTRDNGKVNVSCLNKKFRKIREFVLNVLGRNLQCQMRFKYL